MVTNRGDVPVTFSGFQVTGPNAADFSTFNACPSGTSTLPPQGNTIPIVFTPSGIGARTATLKLSDNATGSPQSISLTGNGLAPTETVAVTPSSFSWGTVAVGSSGIAENKSLYNIGTSGVNLIGLSIAGPNAGDFAIYSDSCYGTLPPGAFCQFAVAFNPTAAGSRTATLRIADDAVGSPQTVPLSGTGN